MLLPSFRFCVLSLGSLMLISLVNRVSHTGFEHLTNTKAKACHNLSLDLIVKAMNRLTSVTSSPTTNTSGPQWNESDMFKILRALELLQHVSGIVECSTLETKQRYLGEDVHSDDENYLQYDDVKVTYDSDNDTVVTVGEDVIVVVEHGVYHYVFNSVMLLLCIAVGALMSGLLMGVMTLEPLMLGVKSRTANSSDDRMMAMKLMPFSKNKNLVLVSILIVNCGVNEALPVFFDALLDSPWLSILCALTVVLLVGEILPSAYFTGTDQIRIASKLIPVLRIVIILTSPISYPLSKLMDKYFHEGDGSSAFKRSELNALVRIQYEQRLMSKRQDARNGVIQRSKSADSLGPYGPCNIFGHLRCVIQDDEHPVFLRGVPTCQGTNSDIDIDGDDIAKVEGALTLKTKTVVQSFTPLCKVVAVNSDTVLNEAKIIDLYRKGYSRIPVFKAYDDGSGDSGICGILLTKQLIVIRKEDERLVSTLSLYQPPCVSPDTCFNDAFNIIQSGNSRMSSNIALVCENPEVAKVALYEGKPVPPEAGVLGIITLKNILEQLIQEHIFDEKDRRFIPSERLKWAVAKWKAFTLRRRLEREQHANNEIDNAFDFVELRDVV